MSGVATDPGSALANAPRRAKRFDWERAIRSAELARPSSGRKPKASLPLVALTLATYANADGSKVFPSQGTIAKGHGITTDTVRRALRELERQGYLVRVAEATPTRAAEYVLTLPVAEVPPPPSTEAGTPWDTCEDPLAPMPHDQISTRSVPAHQPSQDQTSLTKDDVWEVSSYRPVGSGEYLGMAARDEARRQRPETGSERQGSAYGGRWSH